jgi:hypothetical protein
VGFAAIPLCVASQRVFIVVSVYFVMDSVPKLLDTLSKLRRLSQARVYLWQGYHSNECFFLPSSPLICVPLYNYFRLIS